MLRDALGSFELFPALCAAIFVGWHDLFSGTAGQARRRKGYIQTARVERELFEENLCVRLKQFSNWYVAAVGFGRAAGLCADYIGQVQLPVDDFV